jgi:hypothetical protein
MSWTVTQHQTLEIPDAATKKATRAANPTLRISLQLEWTDDTYCRADSLQLSISINDEKFWPIVYVPLGGIEMAGRGSTYALVPVPLSPAIIERIEARRAADPQGSLSVKLEGRIHFQQVQTFTVQQSDSSAYPTREVSVPSTPKSETFVAISGCARDHWLGLLDQLGWNEFAIFEIPLARINQQPDLVEGMKRLQAAHKAFRMENWPSAVTECRTACEAAASLIAKQEGIENPEKKRKEAYEALAKRIFPYDHQKPKYETLSNLMVSLSHLRDAGGAHGWNFGTQIQRHDAEVALAVATAVFRYMGAALSDQPPKSNS